MKHTLEMKNIVKRFPGVLANDRVNLTIRAGEIHALLGENGAGKSTLMQILYGFHSLDSGEIFIDGERIRLGSPKDAISRGIGMVHQEFMLLRPFSVVENTVLGLREGSGPLLDLPRASEKLKELSDRHALALDPAAEVGSLPIGVQQRVEILKLLYRDARILILDEPTAVLTPMEKDQLFGVLRKLRADGRSVVLVTHKLTEIMEIADRVTVMRDGQVVATREIDATSGQELTQLMVGREVNLRAEKSQQKRGGPVMQVAELRVRDESGHEKVRGLSLDVHAGEILGIAGVDGNGQSELAEAAMHLREIASGRVLLNGADITRLNVAQHRAAGLSYVPADRRHVGSVTEMSVADNAILGLQRKYTRGLFRRIREARESAQALVSRFEIRTAGIDFAAGKLSGGNLQKLILGREIMRGAAALIVEQPTRGLDVGAVEAVWGELLGARQEGKAILLISAELEELLNLADRIAVMFEGRIMGVVDAKGASVEEIGLLMAGIAPGNSAAARGASKETRHGEIL
ncbi:MAG TPA: ABC transporter ATP-binding protein [Candidatus Acidoferrales bacterium]|nr:ABC transporter ATP-binding protein [Candidatus Acidoferrales bacterium]